MQWTNPHVWLHMDVKMPDGTVESWAFEAGTPNVLFRRGFTKNSLLPGTKIVIDGYRAKDGSRRANGRDITFAGRKQDVHGLVGHGRAVRADAGESEEVATSAAATSRTSPAGTRARAAPPACARRSGPLLPRRMIG